MPQNNQPFIVEHVGGLIDVPNSGIKQATGVADRGIMLSDVLPAGSPDKTEMLTIRVGNFKDGTSEVAKDGNPLTVSITLDTQGKVQMVSTFVGTGSVVMAEKPEELSPEAKDTAFKLAQKIRASVGNEGEQAKDVSEIAQQAMTLRGMMKKDAEQTVPSV